ncbi:MAG: TetR/AcrR family transcriptional regulator [Bacteroidetes bacterium]|nr:MAG: TetR/AcrR family transcriptional regulator [Bacteroidota bacterium]TAG88735.1 MAG: TetR/AcrR family transcriptional regulator [Bacteroidota bacterium]
MEELKLRILVAAETLFRKFGTRSITMDEIASHLGMSKKTIYQTFKDKNEIVLDMMKKHSEYEYQMMNKSSENVNDALEEVSRISEYIVSELKNLNPNFIYDLRKYHREAWDAYEKVRETMMVNKITLNMQRGMKEGLYMPDLNIEILVRMRMGHFLMIMNEDIFPPEKFSLLELHLFFLDHFLRGIVTPLGLEKYLSYKKNNLSKL